MATSFSVDFSLGSRAPLQRPDPDAPMRILVMGDFGGRRTPGAPARTRRVDIDNLEQRMADMDVALTLAQDGADAPTTLRFKRFEDFHPDHLYRELAEFRAMADARVELHRPVPTGLQQTLADLLGGAIRRSPESLARDPADLDALVRQIVGGVPSVEPLPRERIAALDAMIGQRMNAVLHDPAFQALEAAWLGVRMLLANVEFDHSLQLHLLDISRDELSAALDAGDAASALAPLLEGGEDGWSLLIGDYSFGADAADVQALAALGAVAARAGAAFIAAAAGVPEPGPHWQALRESAHAAHLGLALPRLLMRLPYGKQTDPIEAFAFEEATNPPRREDYVWGNPAFGCALLIARGFRENGWEFDPSDELELDDMPAHTWRADGESHLQPCAQHWLSEAEGLALLGQGLMPMLSYKQRAAVRLLRSQSLALPPAPLAGPWGR